MKTNFKKALIPFGVIVLGVVGAFASNASKQTEKAVQTAYHYDISQPIGKRCVAVNVENCTPMVTPETCTDLFNRQVWDSPVENGLQCSTQLYKL